MKRQCAHTGFALTAFLMVCASPVSAEEFDLMPEVMFLIDSSGSMQQTDDTIHGFPGGVPSCLSSFDNVENKLRTAKKIGNFEFALSRLSLVQRVLAGSPKGRLGEDGHSPWCAQTVLADEGYTQATHAQDRALLQNRPEGDAERSDAFPNCSERERARDLRASQWPEGNDGPCLNPRALDYREGCCRRFVGAACTVWVACSDMITRPDGLGLDEEVVFNQNGIIHDYKEEILFGLMTLDADPAVDGMASFGEGANGVNLGAVGRIAADNRRAAALLPSNHGFIQPNNDAYSGAAFDLITPNVANHNAVVRERLRGLQAIGRSPLSAQMQDLIHYYSCQDEGGAACQGIQPDPQFDCRERAAILITDGKESGPRRQQAYILDQVAQFADQVRTKFGARVFMVIMGPAGTQSETISAALSVGLDGKVYRAYNEETLRLALNRIMGEFGPAKNSRVSPLVYRPSLGDKVNESVEQLRIAAYGQESDGVVYGRIEVNSFGCPAVLPDEDGRLRYLPAESYEASQIFSGQRRLTVVAENPSRPGESFLALGDGDAVFDGEGQARSVQDLTLKQFEELSNSGDQGQIRRAQVFESLAAYFGPAGESLTFRQLGGFIQGELLSIGPPNAQIDGLSFQAFRQKRQSRPGLVASGARDGRVHFFRLDNGEQVFSFVPRLAWPSLGLGANDVETFAEVDGFLSTGEMAVCRALSGEGSPECPAGLDALVFKTLVVGTMGQGGRNLFGLDLSKVHESLGEDLGVPLKAGDLPSWNIVNAGHPELSRVLRINDQTRTIENLGRTVSKPFLTYAGVVQNFVPQAIPVAIVGCGDGRSGRVGQCVAVVNAVTGEVVKVFDSPEMDAPIVGSAVGFPSGGLSTAQLVYIGDASGRLWRLDMRQTNPIFWTAKVAWPPPGDEPNPGLIIPGEYQRGRAIIGRPALSRAPNGKPLVVFGTAGELVGQNERNFVVSFTDELVVNDQGELEHQAQENWVFPLRENEQLTANPVIRSGVAYFTTVQKVPSGACGRPSGRLYAMDYSRTVAPYESDDGRVLNVEPGFPILRTENGKQVTDALALRLAPGTLAFGLALINVPSCLEAEEPTTEVILNIAASARGGAAEANKTSIERKSGLDADGPLADDALKESNALLAISLRGEQPANANGDAAKGDLAPPFPRRVLYWGSSFVR